MRIAKSQRWPDLIVFLVARHFAVSVDEVIDGIPVHRKWRSGRDTARASARLIFERDIDEPRAAEAPIQPVARSIEDATAELHAYRLSTRAFYLPCLLLRAVSDAAAGGKRRGPGGSGSACGKARGVVGGCGTGHSISIGAIL